MFGKHSKKSSGICFCCSLGFERLTSSDLRSQVVNDLLLYCYRCAFRLNHVFHDCNERESSISQSRFSRATCSVRESKCHTINEIHHLGALDKTYLGEIESSTCICNYLRKGLQGPIGTCPIKIKKATTGKSKREPEGTRE